MSVGDWPRDPSVKRTRGGAPPHGHVRRCQGAKKNGDQCPFWASVGYDYCKSHGRRHKDGQRRAGVNGHPHVSFYSRRSGQKMKDLLEAVAGDERTTLANEVDLARLQCERAVHLYESAILDPKNADGTEKLDVSPELKAKATTNLRQALDFVAKMVQRHAAVMAVSGTTVPVERLEVISTAVSRALDRHLASHPELLKAVSDEIAKIRIVPAGGDSGPPQRIVQLVID